MPKSNERFFATSGKVTDAGSSSRYKAYCRQRLEQGQSITTAFDPLLAKVFVHAPTTRMPPSPRRLRAVQKVVCSDAKTQRRLSGSRSSATPGLRSGEVPHRLIWTKTNDRSLRIDGDPDEG